jgi:ribosomal protein L24
LNDKVLVGFVSVKKQDGKVAETTHYKGRYVEGFNWVWLARRNSRTVKVENEIPVTEFIKEPAPVKPVKTPKVKEPKLTKVEILAKVSAGEIKPEDATKLLEKAA